MGRAFGNAKENLRRAVHHQVLISPSRRHVEVERDALELLLRTEQPAVSFSCEGLDPSKPTMAIAGGALSKAQLSDIIRAYYEAHPRSTFACALEETVRRYGSFE
jgi:hypothetical protein